MRLPSHATARKVRLYSLFTVATLASGRKQYTRASDLSLTLPSARTIFQSMLIASALGMERPMELRPVGHFALQTNGTNGANNHA